MKEYNMNDTKELLEQLYNDQSKHSNYQNIPTFVQKELNYSETINEEWRGDTPRYNYLLQELTFAPNTIVGDVGANTGFFTLSLGESFPETRFIAYEPNPNHAYFIEVVKKHFRLENVRVKRTPIILENLDSLEIHDTLLLLNVLHHAGYDFDTHLDKNIESFKEYAKAFMQKVRQKTSQLVFQMGYNWGGNKKNPIVHPEDDIGKIVFSSNIFNESGWEITQIAIATRDSNRVIIYRNTPKHIVRRIAEGKIEHTLPELKKFLESMNLSQFIGEFYRRPIFICDSRQGPRK